MKLIIDTRVPFFGNYETLLIALMAMAMPFKLNLGNLAIILSSVYALILIIYKKVSFNNFKYFYFVIPVILYVISICSALTSKDILEGVFQLEKLLLMVIIPFVLCSFKERGIRFLEIMISYSIGVTLSVLILLVLNLYKILAGEPFSKLFFFDFTMLYDQHPVYFSTNIILSIFFLIHYGLKDKFIIVSKNWIYLILMIHVLGLIFCASKAVIICFLGLLILYFFLSKQSSNKLITLVLINGGLSLGAIFFVPQLKERFVEGLVFNSKNFTPTNDLLETKKFNYLEKTNISDLELRLIFFKIGLYHLIEDDKLMFGYGLGDVQNYLDYYYMTYNLAPNWYEGFNLHNQYLQYLVTYGAFTLLIFIFYLLYSLFISIKTKNILHLFFMIMILFVFIFEVYLARNKGIVLLFFFNTFFLTQNFKIEDSNSRN